jgi:phosphopantetheinyl transferase
VSDGQSAELWCVDLLAAAEALHALEARTPRLAPLDEVRAAAFSDAEVREEWRAAHIALRLLIERAAGPQWRRVTFDRERRGKPHLDGAPLAFSLSHAPGVALIGLARRGSIGVDVERARPVRVDAARRARIIEAAAALGEAPLPDDDNARFLQAWVRLEAYAKADGCGIGRLLTQLGILGAAGAEGPGDRARALRSVLAPGSFYDLDLGAGIYAAVACFGTRPARLDVTPLPDRLEALEKLTN